MSSMLKNPSSNGNRSASSNCLLTAATMPPSRTHLQPLPNRPLFIAVSGGSSSGKKQVCEMLIKNLENLHSLSKMKVIMIKMEDFFKDLHDDIIENQVKKGIYNFDHPDAVDFDLLADTVLKISHGLPTKIAHYDFVTHKRTSRSTTLVQDPDVVLIPGIHMLYTEQLRELMDLKVFLDVDSDTRLSKQVIRDTEHRYQKDLESILETYLTHVKPAFEDFILPTKKYADVILPRGEENTVAIELLTEHLMDILCSGKSSELFRQARPTKGDLYSRSLLLRDEDAHLYHPVPN